MAKRPTGLSVVVGGWFVIGVLQGLGALKGLLDLVFLQIQQLSSAPGAGTTAVSTTTAIQLWMMRSIVVAGYGWVLLQATVAAFLLVAAFDAWKLRPWARTALEVASWIGLTLNSIGLAYALWFALAWSHGGGSPWIWVTVMQAFVSAVFALVVGCMTASLVVLRGRPAREAIAADASDQIMQGASVQAPRKILAGFAIAAAVSSSLCAMGMWRFFQSW